MRGARVTFELRGPVLVGDLVRLEPLEQRHAADLAVAAEEDRDTYAFTWVPRADEVAAYIDAQLARAATGRLAPYAQVSLATGRAVGATSYWEPRSWLAEDRLDAVEVGFTWLARSAQGTGVNSEAKLLLFRHAFEEWGVARVDLKTDARNSRSRARPSRASAPASRAC
jgi:RimJ/RimL family protein N-acetyltransferase